MTITLPDEFREELEQGAKAAGFATVDEYVLVMYLRANHAFGPCGEHLTGDYDLGLADGTDTPERVAARRERLNQLIQEGLDSGPAIPVTPEFWEDLRRRVEAKVAAKGAAK
jgi:hypothetical protein